MDPQEQKYMTLAKLPEILDIAGVCNALGISRNSVTKLVNENKLPTVYPQIPALGRQRPRFAREAVWALLSAEDQAKINEYRASNPTE